MVVINSDSLNNDIVFDSDWKCYKNKHSLACGSNNIYNKLTFL